mmetsp:Transcript_11131/g.38672  ORF Transcript_11131/g.38672 Transcript_11131/m.38672 type:complete len:280 (+) Transcript_11131:1319-2158(+)
MSGSTGDCVIQLSVLMLPCTRAVSSSCLRVTAAFSLLVVGLKSSLYSSITRLWNIRTELVHSSRCSRFGSFSTSVASSSMSRWSRAGGTSRALPSTEAVGVFRITCLISLCSPSLSAICSALEKFSSAIASAMVPSVTSSPRSVGSNTRSVSRLKIISPSVVAAAKVMPSGENLTDLQRTDGRAPLLPFAFELPAPPPPLDAPGIGSSSSGSDSLSELSGRSSTRPASVSPLVSSLSPTPSMLRLYVIWKRLSRTNMWVSYMQMCFEAPAASRKAPSLL